MSTIFLAFKHDFCDIWSIFKCKAATCVQLKCLRFVFSSCGSSAIKWQNGFHCSSMPPIHGWTKAQPTYSWFFFNYFQSFKTLPTTIVNHVQHTCSFPNLQIHWNHYHTLKFIMVFWIQFHWYMIHQVLDSVVFLRQIINCQWRKHFVSSFVTCCRPKKTKTYERARKYQSVCKNHNLMVRSNLLLTLALVLSSKSRENSKLGPFFQIRASS